MMAAGDAGTNDAGGQVTGRFSLMMAAAAARDLERRHADPVPTAGEPRCVGHYVFSGYSHHGLAKNCHHAECRALAEAFAAARGDQP